MGGGSAAEAPNMAGNGGHEDEWTATPSGEKDLGGPSRGAEIFQWGCVLVATQLEESRVAWVGGVTRVPQVL